MFQEPKKISSFIFLALAIILSWQAMRSFSSVFTVRTEIEKYNAENKKLADINGKLDEISSLAQKNPGIVEKFNLILPDNDTKPNFISALENAALSSGILIKKMDFLNSGENPAAAEQALKNKIIGDYEEQTVKVNFGATYFSFKNFLAAMESSLRITDVTKIDFKPIENVAEGAAAENRQKAYEFDVTLKTYLQRKNNGKDAFAFLNAAKFNNFSFVGTKQFISLVSPPDYDIIIDKANDLNNSAPF